MRVAWALLAVLVFVSVPRLGAEDVKIIGRDFMFDAPAMLDVGMTTFGFENPGEVRHEMIIVLLRPAVTAQHITEALQSAITLRKVREQFGEGDILGILLANLVHGRTYLIICQVEEPPGAPRHNMLGMYTTFRVE
jgi:hypothetical protein